MRPWYGNTLLLITLVSILTLSSNLQAGEFGSNVVLSPIIEQISTESDTILSVVIFLENTENVDALAMISSGKRLSRSNRIKQVTTSLKRREVSGSKEIQAFLDNHSKALVVKHWIVPAFTATLSMSDIVKLSQFESIRLIAPNAVLIATVPVETSPALSLVTGVSNHLQMIGVPQVWAKGYTGKGRLVASFDTGVDYDHPALASKWRGNNASLGESWFSTITPNNPPSDRVGHGSHTMGVMIGSDGADTIGVAPSAQWITAGVVDQGKSLDATLSDIIQAFQWTLDPDGDPTTTDDVPDVILNSWGIPAGIFSACDDTFWEVIDAVEAAGIVTIFSAGNEGPEPMTIRNPADRATTPTNSFSVGAVNEYRVVPNFSSRGPAPCNTAQIKPEVVGPGVSIRSAAKGGGYVEMTGTSMAAPYIAGMVALAREFDPDATVEEIKWAMMRSALDKGSAGEDTSYGYGLVNANRMIEELEAASNFGFAVSKIETGSGTNVLPDANSNLYLTLNKMPLDAPAVLAELVALNNSQVAVSVSQAQYVFGGSELEAESNHPFELTIDKSVPHGSEVNFIMILTDIFGVFIDTLEFTLPVGYEAQGTLGEHISGSLAMSVSDFGQFGFAPGSIYNLEGHGLKYESSANLLYEGGIVLASSPTEISSAVRDELGNLRPSDFFPVEGLSTGWLDTVQGFHRKARFTSSANSIHEGIVVNQQTVDFIAVDDNGIIILQYFLVNTGSSDVPSLRLGFLADFDLNIDTEFGVYDKTRNIIYQQADSGPLVGLVPMQGLSTYKLIQNKLGKNGLSNSEIYDILSSDSADIDEQQTGDLMFMIGSENLNIKAGDSAEVAFAIVVGDNLDDLFTKAERARDRYFVVTSVEPTPGELPNGFVLDQNYPNPFNPTTTISFELSIVSEVQLEVYNLLGQKVSTLHGGTLGAGKHEFIWNAQSDNNEDVASGIYFYRLQVNDTGKSLKMVLLR